VLERKPHPPRVRRTGHVVERQRHVQSCLSDLELALRYNIPMLLNCDSKAQFSRLPQCCCRSLQNRAFARKDTSILPE
jgi:hypothetical protein